MPEDLRQDVLASAYEVEPSVHHRGFSDGDVLVLRVIYRDILLLRLVVRMLYWRLVHVVRLLHGRLAPVIGLLYGRLIHIVGLLLVLRLLLYVVVVVLFHLVVVLSVIYIIRIFNGLGFKPGSAPESQSVTLRLF